MLVDYFVRFLYFFTDKILVASKGFISKIKSQNVNESKLIYWPQWGEEFEKVEVLPSRRDLGLPEGFIILFAGNIGTSQAFETVVEAADKLQYRSEIKWVILGDGLKKEWLEKEVERRELKDQVYLLGRRPIEEMPLYYSHADSLLISLSDDPIFSLTIPGKTQSCLASGKPIIASINGETAKLVKEANCGETCEASNVQELVLAVDRLTGKSESELEEMGKKAQEYFQEHFLREKLLLSLENIMETR